MSWVALAVAVPVAFLMVALVHDFFAGLSEERLWSDPYLEDPESFRNRAAAAELTRRVTTVTSVELKPAAPSIGPIAGIKAG